MDLGVGGLGSKGTEKVNYDVFYRLGNDVDDNVYDG